MYVETLIQNMWQETGRSRPPAPTCSLFALVAVKNPVVSRDSVIPNPLKQPLRKNPSPTYAYHIVHEAVVKNGQAHDLTYTQTVAARRRQNSPPLAVPGRFPLIILVRAFYSPGGIKNKKKKFPIKTRTPLSMDILHGIMERARWYHNELWLHRGRKPPEQIYCTTTSSNSPSRW